MNVIPKNVWYGTWSPLFNKGDVKYRVKRDYDFWLPEIISTQIIKAVYQILVQKNTVTTVTAREQWEASGREVTITKVAGKENWDLSWTRKNGQDLEKQEGRLSLPGLSGWRKGYNVTNPWGVTGYSSREWWQTMTWFLPAWTLLFLALSSASSGAHLLHWHREMGLPMNTCSCSCSWAIKG